MTTIPSFCIESVAGCVPANEVDNRELCTALVGADKAEAIVKSTGFARRRVLEPGRSVLELMRPAARRALEGVEPAELAGVVAVSFSAPGRFPALSAQLQAELGLSRSTAALDLQLACAGYPYGLMVAAQLAASTGGKVLLVDGDVQSAHVDPEDISTLAVMSDAATATLVSPATGGAARFASYTDGAGGEVLKCGEDGRVRMDGFGVFRFVAGAVTGFLREMLTEAGTRPDFFVPHQANMYMVRQLAKALGLEAQLLTSGERYANPGSCSVPLTLAAAGVEGRLGDGLALLTGFGAGLSASAMMVRLSADCRYAVVEA